MENKKILITGGAGFIGSNLALTLQEKFPKAELFVIDNFSSSSYENLLGFKGDVIAGDVSQMDLNYYFPEGVDIIFHQASITDTTVFDQGKMMRNNVEGFRNVLNLALKNKAQLIYASSAAVYGHSEPPMRVGENEGPANIYGFSKLVMDNIARKYFDLLPITGLRYFNVYGPGEKYKGKNGQYDLAVIFTDGAGFTAADFSRRQPKSRSGLRKRRGAGQFAGDGKQAKRYFQCGLGASHQF